MKMKKSDRFLLAAGIFPVLIVAIIFINLWMMRDDVRDAKSAQPKSASQVEKTFDLKDFSVVSIQGNWACINIVQSDGDYKVVIKAPGNIMDNIKVEKDANTLSLAIVPGKEEPEGDKQGPEATIVLPRITKLELAGVIPVYLSGIRTDDLSVNMQGIISILPADASDVSPGPSMEIKTLSLGGNGVFDVELMDASVINAGVNFLGIYRINLSMNGGRLSGSLGGIGNLLYSGDVSKDEIQINNPASSVVHKTR
jgi:HSP20 family molecular chaperone IbpA